MVGRWVATAVIAVLGAVVPGLAAAADRSVADGSAEFTLQTWIADAKRYVEVGDCGDARVLLDRARDLERHVDRLEDFAPTATFCAAMGRRTGTPAEPCYSFVRSGFALIRSVVAKVRIDGRCRTSDPVEAERWFRKAAAATVGMPRDLRQNLTSAMYGGSAVPPGLVEAFAWIESVEKADARAQYDLARRLRTGDGIFREPGAAMALFTMAAGAGLPEAQYEYAFAFFEGRYHILQPLLGYIWLHKSARADHVPAQVEMARRYAEGDGMDRSPTRAYFWYRRAQGNGADVSDAIGRLVPQTTQNERELAEERLEGWPDAPAP